MKVLRRSNTTSPGQSSPSSSWNQLRSLLVVASTPAQDRYDLDSTEADRSSIQQQRRTEYQKLRRRCRRLNHHDKINRLKGVGEVSKRGVLSFTEDPESPLSEDFSARPFSIYERCTSEEQPVFDKDPERNAFVIEEGDVIDDRAIYDQTSNCNPCNLEQGSYGGEIMYDNTSSNEPIVEEDSGTSHVEAFTVETFTVETDSSESESSVEDDEMMPVSSITEGILGPDPEYGDFSRRTSEDFATWWRIIRLDALRIDAEWVIYSPNQATISEDKAKQCAVAVGLKDYDHLEPCMIYHASRLVALLEAYALYDPEIGYCQGMSDLLSPILAVIEDDHEAFWCFVGFMRKARHNFRLDEVGIQRQLGIVAKIIKSKDLHLYRHLENLQAEDCCFLYRMVVVLFRRELSFEQTVCLWEVMWADQAAIRAGIGKSSWGRIRLRPPPTDDLLLYAIAACVLQRRKLIIQKYSSMDEIIRECNDMAGQLDVWRLLDDAHDLVVTLHDRI